MGTRQKSWYPDIIFEFWPIRRFFGRVAHDGVGLSPVISWSACFDQLLKSGGSHRSPHQGCSGDHANPVLQAKLFVYKVHPGAGFGLTTTGQNMMVKTTVESWNSNWNETILGWSEQFQETVNPHLCSKWHRSSKGLWSCSRREGISSFQ